MVVNTTRAVLALVAFALLAAVAVSEHNPVFLVLGVIAAAIILLFGRKRRVIIYLALQTTPK